MRTLLYLIAIANAACLRKTEFHCADSTACGASGVCESNGFCSFADDGCDSGRRYDQSAGALAGECTGGGTATNDSGIDSTITQTDGGMDTPSVGCPSGYNPLAGAPGHLYKLVPNGGDWGVHKDSCVLSSAAAYLAIPDDISELTALDTLAGAGNYWVGVSDRDVEGTYRTVFNQPQTFLPWTAGAPDNAGGGQGEDCVESLPGLHQFNDRRCNDMLPAICECNP